MPKKYERRFIISPFARDPNSMPNYNSKRNKNDCSSINKLLRHVFHFLSTQDLLSSSVKVNRFWKQEVLNPKIWKEKSKVKWEKWRKSELCLFPFLFRGGESEEEITKAEIRIGWSIRHDIRELMKECSGLNFPGNLLPLSFHPAICLNKISSWRRFDEFCQTEFGCDAQAVYGSFVQLPSKFLIIGSNLAAAHLMLVLFDTKTHDVISLEDTLSTENLCEPQFKTIGPFAQWFDSGGSFPEVDTNLLDMNSSNEAQQQMLRTMIHNLIRNYRFCLYFAYDDEKLLKHWSQVEEKFEQAYLHAKKLICRTLLMHSTRSIPLPY
mmetsp:Transcript_33193/g.43735  ORF Transcript_33193/g.43735 Transcript_33193/m.43735 type:complete len:323 (-) Transcript_33193:1079-2047(-)